MILSPVAMTQETDPKKAAQKCFDDCGLDPDLYRIGHTKASHEYSIINECLSIEMVVSLD